MDAWPLIKRRRSLRWSSSYHTSVDPQKKLLRQHHVCWFILAKVCSKLRGEGSKSGMLNQAIKDALTWVYAIDSEAIDLW